MTIGDRIPLGDVQLTDTPDEGAILTGAGHSLLKIRTIIYNAGSHPDHEWQDDVVLAIVELQAGGGSSGKPVTTTSSGDNACVGGGGGGGYLRLLINREYMDVQRFYPLHVGSGGAARSAGAPALPGLIGQRTRFGRFAALPGLPSTPAFNTSKCASVGALGGTWESIDNEHTGVAELAWYQMGGQGGDSAAADATLMGGGGGRSTLGLPSESEFKYYNTSTVKSNATRGGYGSGGGGSAYNYNSSAPSVAGMAGILIIKEYYLEKV